ncbi:unnamed protein product [Didymodactylos carnosus]|uniref:Uncharacterized protein n=1 Tax=Didymodactylos carnosus TaxID=1234261 RepID=A0A8S2GW60_9BILA|nr:unnamed protein product [Didymodactylos carnosus]CAF3568790.1 unnamed protein product [Didymodactylos carnosus]
MDRNALRSLRQDKLIVITWPDKVPKRLANNKKHTMESNKKLTNYLANQLRTQSIAQTKTMENTKYLHYAEIVGLNPLELLVCWRALTKQKDMKVGSSPLPFDLHDTPVVLPAAEFDGPRKNWIVDSAALLDTLAGKGTLMHSMGRILATESHGLRIGWFLYG